MSRGTFESVMLPEAMPDSDVWELFHENSKTSRFRPHPADAQVYGTMLKRHAALPMLHAPVTALPPAIAAVPKSLTEAMSGRESARDWPDIERPLTLEQLASFLYYTAGVTRRIADTGYGVDFRVAPSGGGLYPVELFMHVREVDGLDPGLYHYDSPGHLLHQVREGDMASRLSSVFVQGEVPYRTTVMFFLTALFRRSTFKYRDRGYRFVLMEAGHMAQNMNLLASALSLPVLNIGGYLDRQLDELLEFDGVNQSVVYVVAIGGNAGP